MSEPRLPHSCSTFLLSTAQTRWVGHNLDDYIEVPGQVLVNPRNIAKENISWKDLTGFRNRARPRIRWVAKYGSITCNTFGREFPDGGLNEAGLYIGEMTLFGTQYPPGQGLPKIYHNQWIQYILDNCDTVDQVLASQSQVVIDGHCQWHFFTADQHGQAAVIEFLNGEAIVYTGDQMPVKVLCNAAYAQEIAHLSEYEGFGGTKPVSFDNSQGDERFVQAATMLQQYETMSKTAKATLRPAIEEAFAILAQMDCGNNKWSIVFDIHQMRVYFRTYRASAVKFVDFAAFNFSGAAPAMFLDIHQAGSGDVNGQFRAFNEATNRAAIGQMLAGIYWLNPFLNKLFKPWLVHKLSSYPKVFHVQNGIHP